MKVVILSGMPGWLIPLVLLAIFAVIALGVFLIRKYAKPFKNDEKPKSDKEIAEEEVQRLTKELDEEEYEAAKERKKKKEGKPTEEENAHDYMWRMHKGLPERGEIAILNRSYYEDIISPKIYDTLDNLPKEIRNDPDLWEKRYKHINNFEEYMKENGFPVMKFYFHMSKDEQKKRFLERLENKDQNHEFSFSDIEDRKNWDKYQEAFEQMLNNTASEDAPWYVLPADNPWLSRKIATLALIETMEKINPTYPSFEGEEKEKTQKIIADLKNNKI